jgi:hypothetical protein
MPFYTVPTEYVKSVQINFIPFEMMCSMSRVVLSVWFSLVAFSHVNIKHGRHINCIFAKTIHNCNQTLFIMIDNQFKQDPGLYCEEE